MADQNLNPTKPIGEVMVEPHGRRQVSLGNFGPRKHPRGFSIEFDPDPKPLDPVETRIATVGTPNRYELVMHIANNGTTKIAARVWSL